MTRERPDPSLARLAGACAMVFGIGFCLAVGLCASLCGIGREDIVLRLAQALGSYVRWRMPDAPGAIMALAILGANLPACACVALAGVGAAAVEMWARASGGLLDRVFHTAYQRPAEAGRIFRAVSACPAHGPRTGVLIGCVVPVLCLLSNGLYTGIAAACALFVLRVPPASVGAALSHGPLELVAVSVSAGLGLLFCGALADGIGDQWHPADLRVAVRRAFSWPAVALVVCALAVSAIVETLAVASFGR